jgi:serine/threonine protein phosphatase PrpC
MGLFFWPFRRRRKVEPVTEPPRAAESVTPLPDLWQVVGATVRGASHERTDLPNQDAISWRPESGMGRTVLLAVADGHGSSKSFRSETGSRLAVETALATLQDFLDSQPHPPDLSAWKRAVDEDLPVAIERRWKAAVTKHVEENPLLVKEVARVEEAQGAAARQVVERDPVQAYGTTLITLVLHESFLACLQLGDGDVLVVTRTGEVIHPIADDPRLMANETTSLCGHDCWRDFRSCFQALSDAPPALLLVSTDGYSNSFSTPEGFRTVGSDLLRIVETEGTKSLVENLPKWLEEASRQGSGDDVTAAIVCRLAAVGEEEEVTTAASD